MEIKYTINLPPITKKNSQQIMINRKTGKPFIMPSKKYKEYEKTAAWHLNPRPASPIDREVNIKCLFYMPTRRRTDLTNLLEAIDDLLVSTRIIKDDHYEIVAAHDGSRCLYDKNNPRTEIIISDISDNEQQRIF